MIKKIVCAATGKVISGYDRLFRCCKKSGMALEYVPGDLRDIEISWAAVEENPAVAKKITPKDLRSLIKTLT